MAKQTLFSLLSRAPWWMSAAVAGVLFALMRLTLPDLLALAVALPFLGVAAYAAWHELRAPSAARVSQKLETLRSLSWPQFSRMVTEGFQRDGYSVTTIDQGAADLELQKQGRVALVRCRRWKAAQTGIDAIRQLHEVRRVREAHESIYLAAGDFTANARQFAAEHRVRLLNGAELVQWLSRFERTLS